MVVTPISKKLFFIRIFIVFIVFLLSGCCDEDFLIDRNVRIVDQGITAKYRYKIYLKSIRCGSNRHGISFTTHKYKDRDSIEFNQRTGSFDSNDFRLTNHSMPPREDIGISSAYIVPRDVIKGFIQIEKDFFRVNIQLDSSISYGKNLPAEYKAYGYNGVYNILREDLKSN